MSPSSDPNDSAPSAGLSGADSREPEAPGAALPTLADLLPTVSDGAVRDRRPELPERLERARRLVELFERTRAADRSFPDPGAVWIGPDGGMVLAPSPGVPGTARLAPELSVGAPEFGREGPARLSPEAEVWLFGTILWELLTDRPFQISQDDDAARARTTLRDFPAPGTAAPDEPIPGELETLTMRCLAAEPERRPGLDELARVICGRAEAPTGSEVDLAAEERRGARRRLVGTGLVLLALAVNGFFLIELRRSRAEARGATKRARESRARADEAATRARLRMARAERLESEAVEAAERATAARREADEAAARATADRAAAEAALAEAQRLKQAAGAGDEASRARLETARRARREAEVRLARAETLHGFSLIEQDRHRAARARLESARGRLAGLGRATLAADVGLVHLARKSPPDALRVDLPPDGDGRPIAVRAVVEMSDGRRIVCGLADGRVALLDGLSGEVLRLSERGPGAVTRLAISREGLVSGSASGHLALWSLPGLEPGPAIQAHKGAVTGLVADPTGPAVSAGEDGRIRVWSLGEIRRVQEIPEEGPAHEGGVVDLATGAGGRRLLSAGRDGALALWDLASGRRLATARNPRGEAFRAVDLSADGRRALAATGSLLQLWSLEPVRLLQSLPGHRDVIHAVRFVRGGRGAISAGRDRNVRTWDLETGLGVLEFTAHEGSVRALASTASPRLVLSAGDDGTVRLLDLDAARVERPILKVSEDRLGALALTPDGRLMLAAGAGPAITLLDVATGRPLRRWMTDARVITALAVTPDGRGFFATTGDGRAFAFSITGQRPPRVLEPTSGPITTLTVLSAEPPRVLLSSSATLLALNIEDGRSLFRRPVGDQGLSALLLNHADAGQVFAASLDGRLTLRSTTDGELVSAVESPGGPIRALAATPDGRWLLAARSDRRLGLLDPATLQTLHGLRGHEGALSHVAAVGRDLAVTLATDRRLRFWSLDPPGELGVQVLGAVELSALAVHADTARVLVGDGAGRLHVLDLGRPGRRRELRADPSRRRSKAGADRAERLAACGRDWLFQGLFERAERCFSEARDGLVRVRYLDAARIAWQTGREAEARRAFQRARDDGEAPAWYLDLCLEAVADR